MNKIPVVIILLFFILPLQAGEKRIDSFATKEFNCPLGGTWRAVSDASMGGSSVSRLVWVKKVVRKRTPVKGKATPKVKKQLKKPDGFLRLEFELKPNPQVSRPDAAPVLRLTQPLDWSGWRYIDLRLQLEFAQGVGLCVLVAEVMDSVAGKWKPVAIPLKIDPGSARVWLSVEMQAFRTMKYWGKLYSEHDEKADWSKVRSLKIVVLSKRYCKGKLTVDEIKLVQ